MTKQIMVTINGKTLSLRGWSAVSGVAVATIRDRRRRGRRGAELLEPPLPGIAEGRAAAQARTKPANWDNMVKETMREFPWLPHDLSYCYDTKTGTSGGDSHEGSNQHIATDRLRLRGSQA